MPVDIGTLSATLELQDTQFAPVLAAAQASLITFGTQTTQVAAQILTAGDQIGTSYLNIAAGIELLATANQTIVAGAQQVGTSLSEEASEAQDLQSAFNDLLSAIDELGTGISNAAPKSSELSSSLDDVKESVSEMVDVLGGAEEPLVSLVSVQATLISSNEDLLSSQSDLASGQDETSSATDDATSSISDQSEIVSELTDSTDGAVSGQSDLASSMSDVADASDEAASSISDSSDSVSELGNDLDETSDSAREYSNSLGEVSTSQGDVADSGEETASSLAKIEDALASVEAKLEETESKLAALGESLSEVKEGIEQFNKGLETDLLGGLGKVAGVTITVAAAFDALKETVGAGIEDAAANEVAQTQLATKLKATGEGAGWTAEQLETMAVQLESGSTYIKPAVEGAENLLLSFTNIKGANFPAVLQTIADVSASTGRDLESTAQVIGRAFNDPEKGVTALTRAHIALTAAQQASIKSMAASGDIAGAQGALLQALSGYTGAAAAQAGTLSGQWEILHRNLDESIGTVLEQSGAFESLKGIITSLASSIGGFVIDVGIGMEATIGEVANIETSVVSSVASAIISILDMATAAITKPLDAIVSFGSAHPNIALAMGFTPEGIADINSLSTSVKAVDTSAKAYVTGSASTVLTTLQNTWEQAKKGEEGLLNLSAKFANLGTAAATTSPNIGAVNKAQVSFNETVQKAIDSLDQKVAKETESANASVLGAGAVKLEAGEQMAQTEIQKLQTEALAKHVTLSSSAILTIMELGDEYDYQAWTLATNTTNTNLMSAAAQSAATDQAKLSDTINQTTTASTIAAAANKAEQQALKDGNAVMQDGVIVLTIAGQEQVNYAVKTATATLVSAGQRAEIQQGITQSVNLRTSLAALSDAQNENTTASTANTTQLAAEAEARKEIIATNYTTQEQYQAAFNLRVQELTQDAQKLLDIKAQTAAQNELNTAVLNANKLVASIADTQQLAQVTSLYGDSVAKLLQQYGLLDTATHNLNLQEQIRVATLPLLAAGDQAGAEALANRLIAQDEVTQSLKVQQVQIAANQQTEKDWSDANTQADNLFLSDLNTLIEGGTVKWQDFWKSLENIALTTLEKIGQDELNSGIIQNLTGSAASGGSPSALAAAGYQQTAAGLTSLTTAAGSASTALGALATSATSTSTASTAQAASTNALSAATTDQTTSTISISGWLDSLSGITSTQTGVVSNNIAAFGGDTTAVAENASAMGSGNSGGGLLGILQKLTGGGDSNAGWVDPANPGVIDYSSDAAANAAVDSGAADADVAAGIGLGGSLAVGAFAAVAGYIIYELLKPGVNDSFPGGGGVGAEDSFSINYNPVTGGQSGQVAGAAGGDVNYIDQTGQQIATALQTFFVDFEKATSSIITSLPQLGVDVSKQGDQFRASINGVVIGIFATEDGAITAAVTQGLKQAKFLQNLPQLVQDYIESVNPTVTRGNTTITSYDTDPQTELNNAQTLSQIVAQAGGAISQIVTDMSGYITTAENFDTQVMQMGLSTKDLTTALADVNSGLIANDTAERDSIDGHTLTAKQQQQLNMQIYNEQIQMQENAIKQDIIELQQEGLALEGQGAYINGLGRVTYATVDASTAFAKSAEVIDNANQTQINNINQLIKSDQDLENQLNNLLLKPSDLISPSTGTSTAASVTSVTSAAQTLQQALEALRENGMDSFEASLDKIQTDITTQEAGLKATSKAYQDLEAAEQAQIALLKEQTQASTDAIVTPLIQQSHGLSAFTISLSALDTQFDNLYTTEQQLGAGSAELTRVRNAEKQAEQNLIAQYTGALNLPLDSTTATANQYALAIQALNQGMSDGSITAAYYASEMSQIQTQAQSDILTMIEGIYNSVGDTADAEKEKQVLEQINFQIQLAQLQVMAQALLATGAITQQLYAQVEQVEQYFVNNPPNWAAIDAASAASSSNASTSTDNSTSNAQSLLDQYLSNGLDPLTKSLKQIDSDFTTIEQTFGQTSVVMGAYNTAVANAITTFTDPILQAQQSIQYSSLGVLDAQDQLKLAQTTFSSDISQYDAGNLNVVANIPNDVKQLLTEAALVDPIGSEGYKTIYDQANAFLNQILALSPSTLPASVTAALGSSVNNPMVVYGVDALNATSSSSLIQLQTLNNSNGAVATNTGDVADNQDTTNSLLNATNSFLQSIAVKIGAITLPSMSLR